MTTYRINTVQDRALGHDDQWCLICNCYTIAHGCHRGGCAAPQNLRSDRLDAVKRNLGASWLSEAHRERKEAWESLQSDLMLAYLFGEPLTEELREFVQIKADLATQSKEFDSDDE